MLACAPFAARVFVVYCPESTGLTCHGLIPSRGAVAPGSYICPPVSLKIIPNHNGAVRSAGMMMIARASLMSSLMLIFIPLLNPTLQVVALIRLMFLVSYVMIR